MKKIFSCIMLLALGMLYGCFGSSSSPPVPSSGTTEDKLTALARAIEANPGIALTNLSMHHLNPLDNMPKKNTALVSPLKGALDGDSGTLTISVADLQNSYEIMFCQLNDTYQVTMDAPECQGNINYIKSEQGTGYFDLTKKPILNNPLGVTGVSFQKVTYTTTVTLPGGDRSFQVSGGLMMPQGITGDKIKGVIVYFHGTSFNKSTVGSNYVSNGETRLNAQVFASQGYIVVLPDYIGQGDDWQNVHPYVLYPKASAKTAIDMLSAVAPIIKTSYQLDGSSVLKLFSAGYSEGGAYSLWFAITLNQNPGLLNSLYQFTHSVGMEGAYNTSRVTKGFLFDNVSTSGGNPYNIQWLVVTNLVKPLLSADAFLSYATYQLNGDVNSVFNPDFYGMKCKVFDQSKCNVGDKNLNIGQAFALPDTMIASQLFYSAMRQNGNGSTYPADILLYSHNSVNSLVSSTLLTTAYQTQLDTVLRAADVDLSTMPDKSVSIISLDKDSIVSPNNYSYLLSTYPSKIKYSFMVPSSQIQVVSPLSYEIGNQPVYVNVDHMQAFVYEFLYALNIFNQF
ncbi:MAG: hypothetical protein N2745_05330 [Syntrophorhabdaceae bacterium]|nr:hypothetical protein [Syntrophorhabdaceae bacterium]